LGVGEGLRCGVWVWEERSWGKGEGEEKKISVCNLTFYEVNLPSERKGDFTTLQDFEQKGKV
jgi:hypothetical protein